MHLKIADSPVTMDELNQIKGDPVIRQVRKLKDIEGIFSQPKALNGMDKEQTVYLVEAWMPVPEGTLGGLFFGVSTIYPGKVGNEFFMTKGHFHEKSDRAEFYWGIKGEGMLLLMDRERNTRAEKVYPGSIHYIGSEIAHRLANTGPMELIVGACWPSDSGHDYDEIAQSGFSARLVNIDGRLTLIND